MRTNFWLENLKGGDHSKDLDVEGDTRIDLRYIGWENVDQFHLAESRPVASCCEQGSEPLWSLKGGKLLD
jgi:hypothetical protein